MLVFAGVLLLINAFFNIIVWPTFWRRIAKDPRARNDHGKPTRFFVVHAILIGFALLIGAASAVAGIVALVSAATA